MILRSAGFITSKLIRNKNAINFAYILYLRGRAEGMPAADIERLVRRWYVISLLPQGMDTSSSISPYFLVYQAAQAKLGDLGFLSRDITVRDLLLNRSDVHHVYPRNHLKNKGMTRGRHNQIANFVLAQSEINIGIGIGDRAPEVYFKEIADQCNGGAKKHGGITDMEELRANLAMSCQPALRRTPGL